MEEMRVAFIFLYLILSGPVVVGTHHIVENEYERLKTFATLGYFYSVQVDVRNTLPVDVYEEILKLCENDPQYECEFFNGPEASRQRDESIKKTCHEYYSELEVQNGWKQKREEWNRANPSTNFWVSYLGYKRPDDDYPTDLRSSEMPKADVPPMMAMDGPMFCERLDMFIPSFFKIKKVSE